VIGRHRHRFAAALFAAALLLWAGAMAVALGDTVLPPQARGLMVALYPDARTAQDSLAALRRAEGDAVAEFLGGRAWLVHGEHDGFAGRLVREGAMAALARLPLALPGAGGCFFLSEARGSGPR
jgi:hypothetical protein